MPGSWRRLRRRIPDTLSPSFFSRIRMRRGPGHALSQFRRRFRPNDHERGVPWLLSIESVSWWPRSWPMLAPNSTTSNSTAGFCGSWSMPMAASISTQSRRSRNPRRVLDEADPIPGRYTLEVSSPGLERPLRPPALRAGGRRDREDQDVRRFRRQPPLHWHPCGRHRSRVHARSTATRSVCLRRRGEGPHRVRMGRRPQARPGRQASEHPRIAEKAH